MKEESKQEFLTIVKKDIINDINEIDTILLHFQEKHIVFEDIKYSKIDKHHYEEHPEDLYLLLGYPEISFNKRGVDLLKNLKNDGELLNNHIIRDVVEFYSERMLEIKVDQDLLNRNFYKNFDHWQDNTEWWVDYINQNENTSFIDYALHSKDYKNRVTTTYFILYDVYLRELMKFKEKGLKIIAEIETK